MSNKVFSYFLQFCFVFSEHLLRDIVSALDKIVNLFIYLLGYFFTVISLFTDLATQEDKLLFLPKSPRPQFLTHPVFGDHLPCQLSCLRKVALRARGWFSDSH